MPRTRRVRIVLVELVPKDRPAFIDLDDSLAGRCLKSWLEADPELSERVDVKVLAPSDREPAEALAARLAAGKPYLVGFSTYIWNVVQVRAAAEALRKACPSALIALGGPQVAGRVERTASEVPAADFIACGEGEETLRELLRCLLLKDRPLCEVRGLAYRGEGRLIKTAEQPLIDLDRAPTPYGPSRDKGKGRTGFLPIAVIEASRGCPFTCKFCEWGPRSVRYVPLDRMRGEFRRLAARYEALYLADADVAMHKLRGPRLLEAFLEETVGTGCILYCELNPVHMSDEFMAVVAREPSRFFLMLGLQTVNEESNRKVGRPFDRLKTEERMRALLRQAPHAQFKFSVIYGLPADDLEGFRATLDWCLAWRPAFVSANHPLVLPGSDFERQAAELGLVYEDEPPYPVLSTDSMGPCEMLKARTLAFYTQVLCSCPEIYGRLLGAPAAGPLSRVRLLERWIEQIESSGYAVALGAPRGLPGEPAPSVLASPAMARVRGEPLLEAALGVAAQRAIWELSGAHAGGARA